MDNELNQLINEENRNGLSSDEEDLVSRCDFEDFEERLKTSQSFVREKPVQRQVSAVGPQNVKDLNQMMQQKMKQTQSRTMQQAPKPQKQQQQPKRNSVDNRQNQNRLLEQAQKDNQELIQKCKVLTQQKKQLEQEILELRENSMKRSSNMALPKLENTTNPEIKLLRIENEELKRVVTKSFDQSKLIKDLTLQVAKLKCKNDDLQQLIKQ